MPPGHSSSPASGPVLACRECAHEVAADALTCPHCQAPRPARAHFAGEGYEWKSATSWLGSPLVHIAFGLDAHGHLRTARGIVAIGQRAVGGVAIGIIATGVISLGVVSLGILSAGVVAVGALAAVGVNALAPLALGVTAFGWAAHGLTAFGWKVRSLCP